MKKLLTQNEQFGYNINCKTDRARVNPAQARCFLWGMGTRCRPQKRTYKTKKPTKMTERTLL